MEAEALRALAELNQRALEDDVAGEGLQHITSAALELLRADHASLRLRDADGTLSSRARAGRGTERPAPDFKLGQGVLGWVAEHGQPLRVDDSSREPRFNDRHERGYAVGSVLSVPIRHGRETLGVLSVSSARRAAFGYTEEALACLLASTAATALHTAQLRELALRDSQTLAYNRRWLLPRLEEAMQYARRHDQPLSLLLMDLDHFKRVNDLHGHPIGDRVLRLFADTVRDCVRAADILVRRGGEEFVLIMPTTTGRDAAAAAERIRARLTRRPLRPAPEVSLEQSVSIGVATWDGREGAGDFEGRADAAMYEAKRAGRDRVSRAPGPDGGVHSAAS
ncbi:MAG: sensor domain-containing diguanylate cyclase [Myxococcales bacterium]|nr:sensor domain-containing diguanylate cyclase [Myxococcales bacterium]